MATPDRKPGQIPQVVLLITVVVLAFASGVAGLARQVAVLGPGLGDIVTFDPARAFPFESVVRMDMTRTEGPSCTLDVGMMQKSGGSLVVEQRTLGATRTYRAHWAGTRTSERATDCGTNADLVLSATDINILATASNGFGAGGVFGTRSR